MLCRNLKPVGGFGRRTRATGPTDSLFSGKESLRIARFGHPVADPALVEDVSRPGRVVAELAAEPLHDGVHQLGVGLLLARPAPRQVPQGVVGSTRPGRSKSTRSTSYSVAVTSTGRPAALTRRCS